MHLFLYLLAIFCLSQSAVWVKWAHADIEVFGFWRLLFAFILIFTFSKLKKSPSIKLPTRAITFAVCSGILFFAHLWTYKYAAMNTRIANSMILFSTNPLFTALVTILFFKGKVSWKIILSYILALFGIWQLVSHQLRFEPETLQGDLSAMSSAVLYSAYILIGQKARLQISNTYFTLILFGTASLCFLACGLLRGVSMWPESQNTWIAIAGLCIFSTLLGHGLFVYLIKYLDINWMSSGKLIEPVLASATAYLFFGEQLNSSTITAFIITSCSLILLIWSRQKNVS